MEETAKPKLMINVPKFTNPEEYRDCVRPTLQMDTLPQNMSKKDKLYFKFKKDVVHSTTKTHILFVLYNDLIRRKDIPHNIRDHFHPLHVLSEKWWNATHSYMYFYPDICLLISHLVYTDY